jgi:hypothetical protein
MSSAAFFGFIYGFVIACLAFVIAGGGHGWVSSLISAAGLVLLPVATVAWVRRQRALIVAIVALGGVADIALVVASRREGFEYVERTFANIPVLVHGWVALWFFWQVAIIIGLLRGTFSSRSTI